MATGGGTDTALWRDIAGCLARARVARPLHCADALLDLTAVADGPGPLLPRLAGALAGWDGHLLAGVPDDALAPALRLGDQIVVAPACEPADGDLVLAYADGALVVRRLDRVHDEQRLAADDGRAPVRLGPTVALVGVVLELRRELTSPRAAARPSPARRG